jgi:hypothetical protein
VDGVAFNALMMGPAEGVVRGRCWNRPLAVGTVFTLLSKGERELAVSLTVQEIRIYGRPIATLDPVVAAELVLTGEGVEHLAPGTLLRP